MSPYFLLHVILPYINTHTHTHTRTCLIHNDCTKCSPDGATPCSSSYEHSNVSEASRGKRGAGVAGGWLLSPPGHWCLWCWIYLKAFRSPRASGRCARKAAAFTVPCHMKGEESAVSFASRSVRPITPEPPLPTAPCAHIYPLHAASCRPPPFPPPLF